MLYDAFEIFTAIASLVCMLATIVCIVFGAKGSHIPSFFAFAGCAFYVAFLSFAKHNMDVEELKTFYSLICGFVFSAVVAESFYRDARRQKKAKVKRKIEEFKHNYSDACKTTYITVN